MSILAPVAWRILQVSSEQLNALRKDSIPGAPTLQHVRTLDAGALDSMWGETPGLPTLTQALQQAQAKLEAFEAPIFVAPGHLVDVLKSQTFIRSLSLSFLKPEKELKPLSDAALGSFRLALHPHISEISELRLRSTNLIQHYGVCAFLAAFLTQETTKL